MNKNKLKKGNENKKYDFKDFFASMQMLIFYLTENDVMKEDKTINKVIKNAPGYLKLFDNFVSFFNNEGKKFTLNKIMYLFYFFKHLCSNNLAETLQKEYRAPIPKDIKEKIIEKFIKKSDPKDLISIKKLGNAVRRLISRYLAGKIETTDIKEDRNLAYG